MGRARRLSRGLRNATILFAHRKLAEAGAYASGDNGFASGTRFLFREWVNRVVAAVSPDQQSFVLLKSGLRGAANGSVGLLTTGDGWIAPFARR